MAEQASYTRPVLGSNPSSPTTLRSFGASGDKPYLLDFKDFFWYNGNRKGEVGWRQKEKS